MSEEKIVPLNPTMAKLMEVMAEETQRVSNLCADIKEKAAFCEAYELGIQEGMKREARRVRVSLGINQWEEGNTEFEKAFGEWYWRTYGKTYPWKE